MVRLMVRFENVRVEKSGLHCSTIARAAKA